MTPIIEIKNLSHQFTKEQKTLKNINLAIYKNSFTVITGKNGSGKTVLVKHLNGLLEPTEGEVIVDKISVKENSLNARKKIGFVFQNSNTQIIGQTVRDDIAFGLENIGLPKQDIKARIEYYSRALLIESLLEKSPHKLSGGEKKKLSIAGILAMQPEVIIFDEPFAGLDFDGVKMLIKIMVSLKNNEISVIVVTHDLEKILAHADRLVVLSAGKIIGNGNPEEVIDIATNNGIRIPKNREIKTMSWLYDEENANETRV